MKVFLIILIISVVLLFIYSSLSSSFPCTRIVRWISENVDMEGKHGNSTQNEKIVDNNNLEISIDWSFLGSENFPHISLYFKNKSTEYKEVKNININFFTNDKLIQTIKVSGYNVLEDCNTQPCIVSQLSVPTDIVVRPNSFLEINYSLKKYINMSPEKGRIKIEINTSIDNHQEIIKEILLDKYMSSYNCIFGKGHALKLVK